MQPERAVQIQIPLFGPGSSEQNSQRASPREAYLGSPYIKQRLWPRAGRTLQIIGRNLQGSLCLRRAA